MTSPINQALIFSPEGISAIFSMRVIIVPVIFNPVGYFSLSSLFCPAILYHKKYKIAISYTGIAIAIYFDTLLK